MSWIYRIGAGTYLSQSERENNATEIYNYFASEMTVAAICGLLGNIQQESTLNPGIKQTNSTSSGWGLIQWTPSTVLTQWCSARGYNWYDGAVQCLIIRNEGYSLDGCGGRWLPTAEYPYTWDEYCALTDYEESTKAYLYERERAGTAALENRLLYASQWMEYFGESPEPPEPPTPPTPGIRHKMPLALYLKRRVIL